MLTKESLQIIDFSYVFKKFVISVVLIAIISRIIPNFELQGIYELLITSTIITTFACLLDIFIYDSKFHLDLLQVLVLCLVFLSIRFYLPGYFISIPGSIISGSIYFSLFLLLRRTDS